MTETEEKPPIVQSSALPVPKGETAATAVAAAAKAQIESRYMMAVARPRDVIAYREKLLKECDRVGFADDATYRLKFTGQTKPVTGLTIRFAEAAMRLFGNIYQDAMVVFDDEEKVLVRVSVTDLETNSCATADARILKVVERRELKEGQEELGQRLNMYGDLVYLVRATDEQMRGKINAEISRTKRNLIKSLVPGDITEECLARCRETAAKRDKDDPDAALYKITDAFAQMNVTHADLVDFIGKPLTRLQPADLQELRENLHAMREGETTWEDIMDKKHPPQTAGKTKNALDDEKEDTPEKDRFGLEDLDESHPTGTSESSSESPPPKQRTKVELLQEIGGFGKKDNELADIASRIVGQAVVDHEKLKKEDLEKLLAKLQGE